MAVRTFWKFAGTTAVATLALLGCSDDDDGDDASGDDTETTEAGGEEGGEGGGDDEGGSEAAGVDEDGDGLTDLNAAGRPVLRFEGVAIDLICEDAVVFGSEGVDAPDNVSTFINLVDNQFCQTDVSVESGTTVMWVSNGNTRHFIQSGTIAEQTEDFDSDVMESGENFVHTFSDAGTFPYFCSIHPDTMTGVVNVT